MARTKADDEFIAVLKDQVKLYREQCQVLREELTLLREQNFRLQEGLLNIRAPEAYRDLISDRAEINTPPADSESIDRQKKIYSTQQNYLKQMESATFKDADDMVNLLAPAMWNQQAVNTSIHDNEES